MSNEPLTTAGRTYLRNVDQFSALMSVISKGALDAAVAYERTSKRSPNKAQAMAWSEPGFLHLWYVVMLVTFGEAFLHDALTECAATDPTVMSNTEQKASYSEVVALGSYEAIERELRSRWARNFVDDGGPTRWIARLNKMFGGKITDEVRSQMEEAWGVRHMVVHHAGITTAEFAIRHPALASGQGQKLSIPLYVVLDYAKAIGTFVRVTEHAMGKRRARSEF